jgi:FAD/FMN-containing dehydrogenase
VASSDRRLVDGLKEVVGGPHVLVDPDVVAGYVTDWTGRFRGESPAVVRPGNVDEVAAIVAYCRRQGIALTVQGGNTGLSGGAVPLAGEVVCSLTRLSALGEVDGTAGQVTAGAGVAVGRVQAAARAAGWEYGVDLASRDSATIGGTVATNAGGLRVLRYGDTRAQVLGVEAVLGSGEVVSHMTGLVKDNTGYHLAGLLCGSEGTLGIVTAVRLRLVPTAPRRVVALVAFDDVEAAVSAAGLVRRHAESLAAAEIFLIEGLSLVCATTGLPRPFPDPHKAFLLLEAAGASDPTEELSSALASVPRVVDVAVAVDSARAAELWRYREAHTAAINTLGAPHKLDVTLPAGRLAQFMAVVPDVVTGVAPAARVWLFGHAADGNIHVNITGVDPDDDETDGAVFQTVAELEGSISAEHGIGTA